MSHLPSCQCPTTSHPLVALHTAPSTFVYLATSSEPIHFSAKTSKLCKHGLDRRTSSYGNDRMLCSSILLCNNHHRCFRMGEFGLCLSQNTITDKLQFTARRNFTTRNIASVSIGSITMVYVPVLLWGL